MSPRGTTRATFDEGKLSQDRAALIPLIVTMAVAVFIVHGPDPLADKEFAILYLVPYVALFFIGPGKFSVDRFMK